MEAVDELLSWLTNIEKTSNTVEAYARDLKVFWQFLSGRDIQWDQVGVTELAEFAAWARQPAVGTTLVNEGVPITVIAKMLDHNSLQMTAHYAHLHDKTLREEVTSWHNRVNARGERMALAIDGPAR